MMAKIHLNKVLKQSLKTRRLTINQMARDCGIPMSVLHGWINGTIPSGKNLHHLKTLSSYLHMSMDDLLFDEGLTRSSLTLFQSEFIDGRTKYRLIIEKVGN
jgi:hypothetical protein